MRLSREKVIWLYLLFGSFTCNSAKQNRACPHVSVCTKPTVISVAWRVQDRIFSTEWPLVVTEWPLVDTPTFQPHKRGVAGALACHSGIEINTRTVQLEEPKRSRSHHARVGVTTLESESPRCNDGVTTFTGGCRACLPSN